MSILLKSVSLLAGITFSVPAFGDCLTAKETKRGVLLTREAPFYSVFYKPDGPGLTEQRLMERDGSLQPVSAVYLHPLLVEKRVSASGTHELKYANAIALDNLPEKKNWQSGTTLFINGKNPFPARLLLGSTAWERKRLHLVPTKFGPSTAVWN
ncbi:hypothetical protein NXC12_CH02731 [Rhizobium etli]|uniref:Lipoprotein n=1 Tax=Rhizobium etli TaxID=29449 RepID=A0AAN1EKK5_RHIET|nr:hypothetical protein NXC12_CH02731 [Rhizobium etli]